MFKVKKINYIEKEELFTIEELFNLYDDSDISICKSKHEMKKVKDLSVLTTDLNNIVSILY